MGEIPKEFLIIELSNRYSGCGYVYLFREWMEVLKGEIETRILDEKHNDNECEDYKKLLIIPKSKLVILAIYSEDENPQFQNILTIYVFNGKEWKQIDVEW